MSEPSGGSGGPGPAASEVGGEHSDVSSVLDRRAPDRTGAPAALPTSPVSGNGSDSGAASNVQADGSGTASGTAWNAGPASDAEAVRNLLARARSGSLRAVGRLLSMVEGPQRPVVRSVLADEPTTDPAGEELSAQADGPASSSTSVLVVGVTGPPGAGKSTTIAALVAAYRERDIRVAVLAVDPSSPYSGGALLGDRIRMDRHVDDPGVFIRSLAARGHLGGLSEAVPAAVTLLGALGFGVVLLETVGVGQSEIEIAAVADPTLVVLNPGAGDAVQAAKAGLLEVADILVVNKADRDGAQQTVRDLRAEASVPILTLIADRGTGIPELMTAIDAHRRAESPDRRTARARAQILSLAQSRLRGHNDLDRLADAVAAGALDAYSAAEMLLSTPTSVASTR